jgi:basic membrane protein A
MKKLYSLLVLLILASLILSACGGQETEEPPVVEEEEEAEAEEEEEEVVEEETPFLACQVTDVGGIDDKSFNATAWKGLTDAEAEYGIEIKYVESQQQTDYEPNINAFLEEGCDLIIPVGYMLGDAAAAAAEANPEQPFAVVDIDWFEIDNLRGSGFAIHEATFLAGYLAAGMTETGKVGTYGGINIPPVTIFMDGFYAGVLAYNEAHGTDVEVLGWDYELQGGLFAGNFESTDDGKRLGEQLLDEGADIIMPVAGPVGGGTLAAMEERGTGLLIGVDSDWSASYAFPEYADYILASALKRMDLFVVDVVEAVMNDAFEGGNFRGTLGNGYVDLFYGSAWADQVPAELKAEIEAMKDGVILGEVSPLPGEVVVPEGPAAGELGSEENPIIWGVVPSSEADEIVTSFETVSSMIYTKTGIVIDVFIATDYTGVIEAACADPAKAHMTSLATFSYLVANQRGCVEAGLIATRYGSPTYNGQIIVNNDAGVTELSELAGQTYCRSEPLSTSGWIAPRLVFQAAGVDPDTDLTVLDTGGHDATALAVYKGTECVSGGTWVDARTSVDDEYPDIFDKTTVLATTPDIPNDGVQFRPDFPAELQAEIINALRAIAQTGKGAEVLDLAYEWTDFLVTGDEFYDPFRQYLDANNIVLE